MEDTEIKNVGLETGPYLLEDPTSGERGRIGVKGSMPV